MHCHASHVVFVLCFFLCIIHLLQYFDTVGWVFWPVKTVSNLYCVGGDVKHCTIQSNPIQSGKMLLKHRHMRDAVVAVCRKTARLSHQPRSVLSPAWRAQWRRGTVTRFQKWYGKFYRLLPSFHDGQLTSHSKIIAKRQDMSTKLLPGWVITP